MSDFDNAFNDVNKIIYKDCLVIPKGAILHLNNIPIRLSEDTRVNSNLSLLSEGFAYQDSLKGSNKAYSNPQITINEITAVEDW
ncbi:hypothetical protein ACFODO_07600 [Acinetobacter sichuanensis]|uniref:Uncharacterized protein n=2 Tax=Acinetobacter sichuanensis TaxID=2136183 RepID=A0A371YI88_9GAMM|nr:hypothetical protein C9E89_023180 [Acinetobacter sichuanensis]